MTADFAPEVLILSYFGFDLPSVPRIGHLQRDGVTVCVPHIFQRPLNRLGEIRLALVVIFVQVIDEHTCILFHASKISLCHPHSWTSSYRVRFIFLPQISAVQRLQLSRADPTESSERRSVPDRLIWSAGSPVLISEVPTLNPFQNRYRCDTTDQSYDSGPFPCMSNSSPLVGEPPAPPVSRSSRSHNSDRKQRYSFGIRSWGHRSLSICLFRCILGTSSSLESAPSVWLRYRKAILLVVSARQPVRFNARLPNT